MIKKFEDVLDIINGKNQKKVENPNGAYPIYGSGGVMGYADDYLCEANTVVIGRKGSINHPLYVEEPFWNVDTAFGLVARKNMLLPKYLYFFCVHYDFDRLSTTVTIPSLTKANLLKIEIDIPDIDEQKKIVDKLDAVAKLIWLQKEQMWKYDLLIKSRFVEMFGDPVHNPLEWSMKKLGDLSIQINSGNTPKGGEQVYVDKGVTFFRSQNVWKDRLEMEDIAYIDEATHASMSRSSLKHGDILMTKTGRINTENSSLGRAALYVGKDDAANVNGHVYFIRLKPGVNNKFILRILVSDEYRDYVRSVCVGGIDKRQLNKDHIEGFPIICPPENMIEEYIKFVEQVDKLKSTLQTNIDKTQLLFDSLMQQYFGQQLSDDT